MIIILGIAILITLLAVALIVVAVNPRDRKDDGT